MQVEVKFENFNVTSVTDGSGIFSGNNTANGWSSFSKTNNGFGSASSALIVGNTNKVTDNDFIDCPIDDRDIFISAKAPGDGTTRVDFEALNVTAITNGSAISVGENNQDAWSAHGKRNNGNGVVTGSNALANSFNIVEDNDIIDSPINDQDYKPGIMTQTL
ncbi:hypothetical protein [Evansella clarkii]|uniref:hypothetical protein n=1 Tax=Evansella clarkii TaxID=79879 RepID=UPI000996924B|nr:hypothetical protein [Evansella clarkii]